MPLTQSDEWYCLLFEQLPEGVIITDINGTIVFVNNAAEKIRSIKRETILGKNIISCHKESSHEKVLRAVANLKKNANTSYHRMVTDYANQKVYENTYASICNQQGEFEGMAVISRDITEYRKSEEEKAHYSHMQEMVLHNLEKQYHNLMLASLEALTNLLEARDIYTDGHSKRVTTIALKLYEYKFGLPDSYFDIQAAAKLHDIGKICIPDRITYKPDKLTIEEFEIVKQHSGIAADVIKMIDPMEKISLIIRHHHEKYDGKGYPDGLSGKDIPLGSRIIAIADSYDAMSSNCPYRNAFPFDFCIKEIKDNSGSQFDPEWVDISCELSKTGSI